MEALKSLCEHDTAATCKFDATGNEEHVESPRHQVSHTVENHSSSEQTYQVTARDSVAESDNISVSPKIGGKITEIINVELSATYGHTSGRGRVSSRSH